MLKRGKCRKERKTVVYNNPPKSIFFQYLPFLPSVEDSKLLYFYVIYVAEKFSNPKDQDPLYKI
jgi:hypothetical protein